MKELSMIRRSRPHFTILILHVWLALAAGGCITPVQAAGSTTPSPTLLPTRTSTPVPSPTPTLTGTPSPTPLPHPVCTIEWAWRDAGLTITAVDFSRLDGLVPGDLVLSIDGQDTEGAIAEIEIGLGGIGDPAVRRAMALDAILFGSDVLLLRVKHGQQPAYYYKLEPGCHL